MRLSFITLFDNPKVPYMIIHIDNRENAGSCAYDRTYYLLDMTLIKEPLEKWLAHAYFTADWDEVIPDITKSERLRLKKLQVINTTTLPFEYITVNNRTDIECLPKTLHKLKPISSKKSMKNINL